MEKDFIDAVGQHNLVKVRMMLSNELLLDSSGDTFNDMLDYAKKYLPDLFETDIISDIVVFATNNEESWSMDLASKIKLELNTNFSEIKMSLYRRMIQRLVPRSKVASKEFAFPSQQVNKESSRNCVPKFNRNNKIRDKFKDKENTTKETDTSRNKSIFGVPSIDSSKEELISILNNKIISIKKELNDIEQILNRL